jgi:methyl-accepting chemotaxis protein
MNGIESNNQKLSNEFKSAIDQSGTPVMMIDRDFKITYFNETSFNLLKKHEPVFQKQWPTFTADRSKIMGTCIDVFHKNPSHQRRILSDPKNLPWKAEINIQSLNFELNVVAIYDENKRYIGNCLEWYDITEHKLRISEYSGKIDAISKSQAVIEFNMDGSIITANENFLAVSGYRLEEIQGKHHKIFVDPLKHNSTEYIQFWEKLNRGEYLSGEYKRINKSGREFWIQASYNPIVDSHGKPFKVVKLALEITEQKIKNADFSGQIAAIQKSQAVIEFDMEGIIITANDNFLETTGYRLDEIQGKHHRIFVDPEYKNSNDYAEFWEKLNKGHHDTGEYKRISKNGKPIWIQASYNPIFDLSGKPYKVVKYATDITSRKQAINEIKDVLVTVSQGDLNVKLNSKLDDEFEILGNSINSLVENLVNMIDEIRGAATTVFSTAREIAEGNNDLSQRTESQASSLEQTASAMEELNTTVQKNAENATEAAKMANQAMTEASNGGNVVQNAVTAMKDIEKSSKKISDIISVIDEIAFQTNLLALNAAVEAARAGEQGRGFAVVATEVRNLAQRSASAAKEIKGLINESVDAVGKGTQLVSDTGQTFQKLVASVESVVEMISSIDNASKEQASGINEVSQAVAQMDEMTQQNAALVEEAASSSKAMEEQAQVLLEQVNFFKIDNVEGAYNTNDPIVTPLRPKTRTAQTKSTQNISKKTSRKAVGQSDNEWEEF